MRFGRLLPYTMFPAFWINIWFKHVMYMYMIFQMFLFVGWQTPCALLTSPKRFGRLARARSFSDSPDVSARMYIYIYIYRERERERFIYLFMYVYIYIYIGLYLYVYIYIYIYNTSIHVFVGVFVLFAVLTARGEVR